MTTLETLHTNGQFCLFLLFDRGYCRRFCIVDLNFVVNVLDQLSNLLWDFELPLPFTPCWEPDREIFVSRKVLSVNSKEHKNRGHIETSIRRLFRNGALLFFPKNAENALHATWGFLHLKLWKYNTGTFFSSGHTCILWTIQGFTAFESLTLGKTFSWCCTKQLVGISTFFQCLNYESNEYQTSCHGKLHNTIVFLKNKYEYYYSGFCWFLQYASIGRCNVKYEKASRS